MAGETKAMRERPVLGVAQVDQRESIEGKPVGNLQPESLIVEVDRTLFVEHPDHGVDGFRHAYPPLLTKYPSSASQRASRPDDPRRHLLGRVGVTS